MFLYFTDIALPSTWSTFISPESWSRPFAHSICLFASLFISGRGWCGGERGASVSSGAGSRVVPVSGRADAGVAAYAVSGPNDGQPPTYRPIDTGDHTGDQYFSVVWGLPRKHRSHHDLLQPVAAAGFPPDQRCFRGAGALPTTQARFLPRTKPAPLPHAPAARSPIFTSIACLHFVRNFEFATDGFASALRALPSSEFSLPPHHPKKKICPPFYTTPKKSLPQHDERGDQPRPTIKKTKKFALTTHHPPRDDEAGRGGGGKLPRRPAQTQTEARKCCLAPNRFSPALRAP